ncbi:MAG: hypothetical protein HFI33_15140 [Lachnospiraceae bacterium]|jgi:hypothetical protein|nr:hypothetical protein [Lachnospiraceae bacterium]
MSYEMEELVPLVGKLAEKYTALDHTSVTYERAEKLMEAVLFCIQEAELMDGNSLALAGGRSAQEAYRIGLEAVERRTKATLEHYNEMLLEFDCYDNRCLYDTLIKGLPEFFKWYDIPFAPQETGLTLDYPVLKDLSGETGIRRIDKFIHCIGLEQEFLRGFSREYVKNLLSRYNRQYRSMIENLCLIVYEAVVRHMLVEKSLVEEGWGEAENLRLKQRLTKTSLPDIIEMVEQGTASFVGRYYGGMEELTDYLSGAIRGILVRLKNRAEEGNFSGLTVL